MMTEGVVVVMPTWLLATALIFIAAVICGCIAVAIDVLAEAALGWAKRRWMRGG